MNIENIFGRYETEENNVLRLLLSENLDAQFNKNWDNTCLVYVSTEIDKKEKNPLYSIYKELNHDFADTIWW